MPGFDTAATLISDVALELGLVSQAVTDPFASTDQNIIQLRSLMKPAGRMLLKAHAWSDLVRATTFNTVAEQSAYSLATVASDFGRVVDGTEWNRTQQQPMPNGTTPQEWQELQAVTSAGINKVLRIQGGALNVYPTPTAVETIAFEYVSRNWGAASFAKEVPTAAADVVQFDPHLFSRALILRFRIAKGFDTVAALDDYNEALDTARGQDGAAPVLRIEGRRFFDVPRVPETGFGQ